MKVGCTSAVWGPGFVYSVGLHEARPAVASCWVAEVVMGYVYQGGWWYQLVDQVVGRVVVDVEAAMEGHLLEVAAREGI